jgi:hypothetical protein
VAPQHDPPEAPALHAFTYTVPSAAAAPTLVVAGAGELIDGSLVESAIIRRGDTRPDAMVEKARYVVAVMAQRLQGLGAGWDRVSAVDVYTVHGVDRLAGEVILPALGPARRHGLRWHAARPPVVDIEFEMDLRGVRSESVV